jgi:hypothetical protein
MVDIIFNAIKTMLVISWWISSQTPRRWKR